MQRRRLVHIVLKKHNGNQSGKQYRQQDNADPVEALSAVTVRFLQRLTPSCFGVFPISADQVSPGPLLLLYYGRFTQI